MPSPGVPALGPRECQVWWTSADQVQDGLVEVLDPAERTRWAELRHERSRALFLAAHALTRVVLGALLGTAPAAVPLVARCPRCAGPHGKPRLAGTRGPRLSVSHSGELAVVAVTAGTEVGVDVERIALAGQQVPVIALAATEREALLALPAQERLSGFIRLWTRKEALLKATGHGLTVAPATVVMSGPAEPAKLRVWPGSIAPDAHLYDLGDRPGHLASLATLDRRLRVTEHDGGALLRAGA